MQTEYEMFTGLLEMIGIDFQKNCCPSEDIWQKAIDEAGYNVLASECTLVRIGSLEFLFSKGQVYYLMPDVGDGPFGLFILAREVNTGEIHNRFLYRIKTGEIMSKDIVGLRAVINQYRSQFKLVS